MSVPVKYAKLGSIQAQEITQVSNDVVANGASWPPTYRSRDNDVALIQLEQAGEGAAGSEDAEGNSAHEPAAGCFDEGLDYFFSFLQRPSFRGSICMYLHFMVIELRSLYYFAFAIFSFLHTVGVTLYDMKEHRFFGPCDCGESLYQEAKCTSQGVLQAMFSFNLYFRSVGTCVEFHGTNLLGILLFMAFVPIVTILVWWSLKFFYSNAEYFCHGSYIRFSLDLNKDRLTRYIVIYLMTYLIMVLLSMPAVIMFFLPDSVVKDMFGRHQEDMVRAHQTADELAALESAVMWELRWKVLASVLKNTVFSYVSLIFAIYFMCQPVAWTIDINDKFAELHIYRTRQKKMLVWTNLEVVKMLETAILQAKYGGQAMDVLQALVKGSPEKTLDACQPKATEASAKGADSARNLCAFAEDASESEASEGSDVSSEER